MRADRRFLAAAIATSIAATLLPACSVSTTSMLLDAPRAPTSGEVVVLASDAPLPDGFRALALIEGSAACNSIYEPAMEPEFVLEAQRLGCTVIVGFEDGRALTRTGGKCGRTRRGEALCGVIER